mmetsp:Transcript_6455/g.14750  ORF Transcript_6455/g.14750 Transcript_6455/m.14750 type:complete len:213 (+) Transcript_6455:159-797(+)
MPSSRDVARAGCRLGEQAVVVHVGRPEAQRVASDLLVAEALVKLFADAEELPLLLSGHPGAHLDERALLARDAVRLRNTEVDGGTGFILVAPRALANHAPGAVLLLLLRQQRWGLQVRAHLRHQLIQRVVHRGLHRAPSQPLGALVCAALSSFQLLWRTQPHVLCLTRLLGLLRREHRALVGTRDGLARSVVAATGRGCHSSACALHGSLAL